MSFATLFQYFDDEGQSLHVIFVQYYHVGVYEDKQECVGEFEIILHAKSCIGL